MPAIQKGQDQFNLYESACLEIAETFGWDHDSVLYYWSQVALARMACGEPQEIAEYLALANVTAALDTRGREPD